MPPLLSLKINDNLVLEEVVRNRYKTLIVYVTTLAKVCVDEN